MQSDELFKSPKAHFDNNPLIISRFNPRSGKHIDTRIGNDLSKIVSADHADYYYIADHSVHDCTMLDPADITAFVLANSHKALNNATLMGDPIDLPLVLFDIIMFDHGIDSFEIDKRKIQNFF